MKAYLDIETTGLSPHYADITVVGISFGDVRDNDVIQLGRALKKEKSRGLGINGGRQITKKKPNHTLRRNSSVLDFE